MKCIVEQIVAKALALIDSPPKHIKLTEVQQKVQDAYSKFDFGCHNENVAALMEALTGRKPVKTNPGVTCRLFDVVVNTAGQRCVILGVSGGSFYGMSVDHPAPNGYISLTASRFVFNMVSSRFRFPTYRPVLTSIAVRASAWSWVT